MKEIKYQVGKEVEFLKEVKRSTDPNDSKEYKKFVGKFAPLPKKRQTIVIRHPKYTML